MPLREVVGDIWDFDCTMRVIPTNGFVKKADARGVRHAVMGAGLAKQAATKYPNLPEVLARCILKDGNHVAGIRHDLLAFPTKEVWWQRSSLVLIERSAKELKALVDAMGWTLVAVPRVGCGNGQLRWAEVKLILEHALGDDPRFVIVDRE